MKKLVFIVFFISTMFPVFAQPTSIKIWPGLAPGTEQREDKELWTGKKEVTNIYQPDLTVFLPEQKAEASSAILIFPGGGYRNLAIEKEGYKIARWFNEQGITAFVLKYRLNPTEALQDAQRAIKVIRQNADKYGIDKNKIGVIGFSAGGNLAANLVENNQSFKAVDEIDNISERPDYFIGVYGVYGDIEITDGIRNFKKFEAHANIPPTFLVHAVDDPKVDVKQSIDLYNSLREKGVPVELHVYEKGMHGFALETNRGTEITSTVNSWSTRCLEWLSLKAFL